MLDRLRIVAGKMGWARLPALLVGLAGLFLFLADVVGLVPDSRDRLMIPGLLLTTCSLLLLVGLYTFPGIPDKPVGFSFASLKAGLLRCIGSLLALVFLCFTLLSLFSIFRLLSAWLRSL